MGWLSKVIPDEVKDAKDFLINPGYGATKMLLDAGGKVGSADRSGGSRGGGGGVSFRDKINLSEYITGKPPSAPELSHYAGNTGRFDIGLTEGEKAAERTATDMIKGDFGTFRQQLSGKPDYGQVNRLVDINDREFELNTLPEMKKSLSSGPYGNTGLARQEEMQARLSMSDQAASLRFQAYQQAKQEAIQAAQILPSLTSVTGMSRNNEVNNFLRDMEIFYQNQNLDIQEFQMQSQHWADMIAHAQVAIANKVAVGGGGGGGSSYQGPSRSTSKYGLLGSLLGGAAGFALGGGPAGAAIGMQLGNAAGGAYGGDYTGATGQLGGALSTYIENPDTFKKTE